jgi:hypothetical protein
MFSPMNVEPKRHVIFKEDIETITNLIKWHYSQKDHIEYRKRQVRLLKSQLNKFYRNSKF